MPHTPGGSPGLGSDVRKDLGPVGDSLGLSPLTDNHVPLEETPASCCLAPDGLPGCMSHGQEGEGSSQPAGVPWPQMAPQPLRFTISYEDCAIHHPISLAGKLRSYAQRLRYSSRSWHTASKGQTRDSELWASPGRQEAESLGHQAAGWTDPQRPPSLPAPAQQTSSDVKHVHTHAPHLVRSHLRQLTL